MRVLASALLVAALVLAAGSAAAAEPGRYPSDEALRHYLAGLWFEQTGELQEADAELARAMALDPESAALQVEACLVASRLGETKRALELARGALARDPGDARALWLEGAALVSESRAAEALVPLRRAVQVDSTNAESWRTLANAAETLDDVSLADTCWSHLVDLDDSDAESWFQLASARARLGRYADADRALTQSLAQNPARPGALFLRGWLRDRLGHPDEAIDLYRHHLEMHPNDGNTRRRLVDLLAHEGRVHEALEEARRVSAAAPTDATAMQAVADLEFRDRQPEAGMKTLARLRALSPEGADGVGRSAEVMTAHQRTREAIKLVDQWAWDHSDDAHGPVMRAWVRAMSGEADSALAYARLAVAAQPDSAGTRRLLARYLRQARHWDEAIAEIGRLREREPGDLSLLLDLGFCREQSGDVPGAIAAGRDALAMAPDSPAALNFLGYLLADHDRDLAEAERLIQRAVSLEPDNGAFVDSMGWLLFRQGALERARTQLERAVTLTGGDPVIYEHLGDVYLRLKLLDLAKQQYRKSLAEDGGNNRVRGKLQAVP